MHSNFKFKPSVPGQGTRAAGRGSKEASITLQSEVESQNDERGGGGGGGRTERPNIVLRFEGGNYSTVTGPFKRTQERSMRNFRA